MAEFFFESSDDEDFIPPRKRIYRPHFDAFNEYSDEEFRQRYRFTKDSTNELTNLLRLDLERTSSRRCTIGPEKQLLLALRYYGGGAFQLTTGDTLRISQSAVCRAVTAVSEALTRRLDDFIQLPEGASATRNQVKFYDIARFPNVISALDCTHIRIVKPSEHSEQFINRKQYPSLNVQAACDADGKFTNVYVKWPGSTHDSFILRQSQLWTTMENDAGRGMLLGDAAYPCRFWLQTPIAAPGTEAETYYNVAHAKSRVVIEQSFGRLKKRFNVLHQENRRTLEHIVKDIVACFILQNFAILRAESEEFEDFEDVAPGRHRLALPVPEVPPPPGHCTNFGLQRRRRIMNQLINSRR